MVGSFQEASCFPMFTNPPQLVQSNLQLQQQNHARQEHFNQMQNMKNMKPFNNSIKFVVDNLKESGASANINNNSINSSMTPFNINMMFPNLFSKPPNLGYPGSFDPHNPMPMFPKQLHTPMQKHQPTQNQLQVDIGSTKDNGNEDKQKNNSENATSNETTPQSEMSVNSVSNMNKHASPFPAFIAVPHSRLHPGFQGLVQPGMQQMANFGATGADLNPQMFYNKMGAYCDSLLNRDKHFWTEEETDAMLELYELNSRYFHDPKTKKTKIWSNIAKIINMRYFTNVNAEQCSQKFRNMKAEFIKSQQQQGAPNRNSTGSKLGKHHNILKKLLNQSNDSKKPPSTDESQDSCSSTSSPVENLIADANKIGLLPGNITTQVSSGVSSNSSLTPSPVSITDQSSNGDGDVESPAISSTLSPSSTTTPTDRPESISQSPPEPNDAGCDKPCGASGKNNIRQRKRTWYEALKSETVKEDTYGRYGKSIKLLQSAISESKTSHRQGFKDYIENQDRKSVV